jgi:hypothetical protein
MNFCTWWPGYELLYLVARILTAVLGGQDRNCCTSWPGYELLYLVAKI